MAALEGIKKLEQALQEAMLNSDVKTLGILLSDDLVFTDHMGQKVSKAADMEAHSSGKVSIDTIEPSEQVIKIYGDTAIVSVLMHLKGQYLGQPFEGKNRYTRIWMKLDNSWKVVAAHASLCN